MAPVHRIALRIASITRERAPSGRASGVHRGQDVLRRRPLVVELEHQLLAVAPQPVDAALQAHPVGLQPVPQPGLRDAVAGLEMARQAIEVVEHVGVEHRHVRRDDAAEQDAPEPRGGRHRQVAAAQRHPAGGGDGPGGKTSSSARITGAA